MRRLILLFGLLCLWAPVPALAQGTQQCVSSVITGGTGDAMTIPHLPCTPTSTLLIVTFSATNITTTPTMQMLGGGLPLPVTFSDQTAMTAGALEVGHTVLVNNNGSEWQVINTASGGSGGGSGTLNSVRTAPQRFPAPRR